MHAALERLAAAAVPAHALLAGGVHGGGDDRAAGLAPAQPVDVKQGELNLNERAEFIAGRMLCCELRYECHAVKNDESTGMQPYNI